MDLTQYKIDKYENGVSNLPDYPSNEGYTAEQLKAVFDSRSENEIKEKHNSLIDELTTAFVSVEAHGSDASAHNELLNNLREEISNDIGQHEADSNNPHNVTAAQIGLDKVDNTPDSEKRVAYADTARKANHDTNGLPIHETYATKEEVAEARGYTDKLQTNLENGAIMVGWAREAEYDAGGNIIDTTYATKKEAKEYTDGEINYLIDSYRVGVYVVALANSAYYDNDEDIPIHLKYVTKKEFNAAIAALQASYTGGGDGGN